MWDSSAEAKRWWLQAENDLEFARMALREKFFHQACFIAQQSAEKALKAVGYHPRCFRWRCRGSRRRGRGGASRRRREG